MASLAGLQFAGHMEFVDAPGFPIGRRYFDYQADEQGQEINAWWFDQHLAHGTPFLPCFTRTRGGCPHEIPQDAVEQAWWVDRVWSKIERMPKGPKVQSVPVEIWNEPEAVAANDPKAQAKLVRLLIAKARDAKRSDLVFLGPTTSATVTGWLYAERFFLEFGPADRKWLGFSFHFYGKPPEPKLLTNFTNAGDFTPARCYITELGVGKSGSIDTTPEQAAQTLPKVIRAVRDAKIPLAHCWAWIGGWMPIDGEYGQRLKEVK